MDIFDICLFAGHNYKTGACGWSTIERQLRAFIPSNFAHVFFIVRDILEQISRNSTDNVCYKAAFRALGHGDSNFQLRLKK